MWTWRSGLPLSSDCWQEPEGVSGAVPARAPLPCTFLGPRLFVDMRGTVSSSLVGTVAGPAAAAGFSLGIRNGRFRKWGGLE